jgi:hypothetical protein
MLDAYSFHRRQPRILAAISFHFLEARLVFLAEVVRELAAFPVAAIDILVFTNAVDPGQLSAIETSLSGASCEIVPAPALDHPYDLTWAHKPVIVSKFIGGKKTYSHFIYLEDDERMSFSNFCYFLEARETLRDSGLIPGFARVEWRAASRCFVNTDNVHRLALSGRPFAPRGRYNYIALDNPYYGAFILDQELAAEYVFSRSFDRARSCEVSSWEVRERAAMALMFEGAPPPFPARCVVPVDTAAKTIPSFATLAHLPNNYADDPNSGFGKIPMADLFQGEFEAAHVQALTRSRRARWVRKLFAERAKFHRA